MRPWPWQEEMIDFALARPAAMLNGGMGSGKTLAAIHVAHQRAAARVLVLCPKAVLGVWRREIAKHWPAPGSPDVLVLDKGTTRRKAEQVATTRARFIIVNYDSAWRRPLFDQLRAYCADLVICDESHRIKSPQSKASKAAAKLGGNAAWRLCLTGTMMPHSPLDIWAQFRFLDPTIFPKAYTQFRGEYAVCHQQFKSKVLKWINQGRLTSKINSLTYRVRSEDVLELEPITHQHVDVELTAKTWRHYRELEEELITEIDGEEIVISNPLTKLLRLQQVTSGLVNELRVGEEKQEALVDLLQDVPPDEPVVVFGKFRSDLRSAQYAAEKTGRRYGEISGSRKDLTEHALMPKDIGLMAVQIQSGGTGIDLTRAAVAFYLSPGFSLGDYEQSVARLHRPGQTRPVRIYHLTAANTVDQITYKALRSKANLVDSVLEGLRKYECDELRSANA